MSKRLDFEYDVAFRRIKNHGQETFIGISSGQQIADGRVTVWDGDGDVTFLTSAVELFITSSNTGDTDQTVTVNGVDTNWLPLTTTAALNGQTEVSVGTFLHVQKVTITAGSINAGDLYLAPTTARTGGVPNDLTLVLSKIIIGEGITHNGWAIIPANLVAGFVAFRAGTDTDAKVASLSAHLTLLGAPTLMIARYNVTASFAGYLFPLPIVSLSKGGVAFPEKTILEYKADVSTNDTEVFISADCIMAGKAELGVEAASI